MDPQQKHFDAIAPEYDRALPPHVADHYLRKRVALIGPLIHGGHALDIGCGTGRLLAALRPHGRLTGVEPSAGMRAILTRQQRGHVVAGAADKLPFADATFDVVFSVAVLHHLAEPPLVAAALREMVRVARPGGKIVVWDHNPLNPYWPLLMKRAPQDTGRERLLPLREIENGLAAAGAPILHRRRSGFVPDFVPRRLMPLARALEWLVERTPLARRLCAHNIIIATKKTP